MGLVQARDAVERLLERLRFSVEAGLKGHPGYPDSDIWTLSVGADVFWVALSAVTWF